MMPGITDHDPGITDHDPGIGDHVKSESVITIVRNTHTARGRGRAASRHHCAGYDRRPSSLRLFTDQERIDSVETELLGEGNELYWMCYFHGGKAWQIALGRERGARRTAPVMKGLI